MAAAKPMPGVPSIHLRRAAGQTTMGRMFESFKLSRLASALRNPRNPQAAYAAVVELGAMGRPKAVDVLVAALERRDGVARSAARELGRIGDPRAIRPLAALLDCPDVCQSAAEALLRMGSQSADAFLSTLKSGSPLARGLACKSLGDLRETRAVDALAQVMQGDPDYAVRTAAARALGELRDPRALYVMVATLKLRDETTPERQAALEELRQAATLAMKKIGDPLATKGRSAAGAAEEAVAQAELRITETEAHPRLLGDLGLLTERELVEVLKDLMAASEEVSWAKLERREPMLPAWFQTYDQRRRTAEAVGAELHRRGGPALLQQVFERDLGRYAAVSNWWHGLEGWQGEQG